MSFFQLGELAYFSVGCCGKGRSKVCINRIEFTQVYVKEYRLKSSVALQCTLAYMQIHKYIISSNKLS